MKTVEEAQAAAREIAGEISRDLADTFMASFESKRWFAEDAARMVVNNSVAFDWLNEQIDNRLKAHPTDSSDALIHRVFRKEARTIACQSFNRLAKEARAATS